MDNPPPRSLIAMVSIGQHRDHSVRATSMSMAYARRHEYDSVILHADVTPPGRTPHYAKLRVLELFPGYDRYGIVDDDLMLSQLAPPLPQLEGDALIGMVPDPNQAGLPNGNVKWAGNTGFLVCRKEAAPLLAAAIALGDQPGLPGHADQTALNRVAWEGPPPIKLDWRWNFIPVAHYFMNYGGFERWSRNRVSRARFYAGLLVGIGYSEIIERVRSAYGLHLTCCLQPKPILRHFR